MNPESNNSMSFGRPTGNYSSNDLSQNQVTSKLVTENAAMDYDMRTLEIKMQDKNEEEKRLLEEEQTNFSTLSALRKQFSLLQDREKSITERVNRIEESNSTLDGLELSVTQHLKAIKLSNQEQRSKCNDIMRKYDTIINSHQDSYSALPWVEERKRLSVQVEKKRMFLDILKLQQREIQAKTQLIKHICESRQKMESIKLAMLMIDHRNCQTTRNAKMEQRRNAEEDIKFLESEKSLLKDRISAKTREMIVRIMDRSKKKEPEKINSSSSKEVCKGTTTLRSIRDRLQIFTKPLISYTDTSAPRQVDFDEMMEPSESKNTKSIHPNDANGIHQSTKDLTTRPALSSGVEEIDPIESTNTDLNQTHTTTDTEKGISEPKPVDTTPSPTQETDKIVDVIPPVSNCPPSLKAILKPPNTLSSHGVNYRAQNSKPEHENEEPVNSVTTTSSLIRSPSTSSTRISTNLTSVDETCIPTTKAKRASNKISQSSSLGSSQEIIDGNPLSKKAKMSQSMQPPRSTSLIKKQKTNKPPLPQQPPKTPKRVSFQDEDLQNIEAEKKQPRCSADAGSEPRLKPNSQPPAIERQDYIPSEVLPQQADKDESVREINVGAATSANTSPPASGQENKQLHPPTDDSFQHLFPPSPEPFPAVQQQGAMGSFDSIFGAIFNNPDTTKDDGMGFQFSLQGGPQKGNDAAETSKPSENAGQDFFSLFGTPNKDNSKKSHVDNFFKLF